MHCYLYPGFKNQFIAKNAYFTEKLTYPKDRIEYMYLFFVKNAFKKKIEILFFSL